MDPMEHQERQDNRVLLGPLVLWDSLVQLGVQVLLEHPDSPEIKEPRVLLVLQEPQARPVHQDNLVLLVSLERPV